MILLFVLMSGMWKTTQTPGNSMEFLQMQLQMYLHCLEEKCPEAQLNI
jgi:hypothetical protein